MASGQTLVIWSPHCNESPSTAGVHYGARNGNLVLMFYELAVWSCIFPGILPRNYSGGGVTLRVWWTADTATTGVVKWNAQLERQESGVHNMNADSFAAAKTANGTAPGTNGIIQYTEITFANGAEMDSLAAGDAFRLKITRDATDAADTMAGYAQLTRAELRET